MMDSVEQSDDDCIYELAYEEHIHFDYCSLSPPRPSCSKEESRERKSSSPSSESGYICLGGTDHVLLFINDHFTLEDDLEDVTTFLTVLQDSGLPIRLRLLNTSRCSVELYLKRNPFKKAFKNDLYGFRRSEEYLEADKNFNKMQSLIATQRDLDWINYLSSIGGTENIKSDGIYKSSPELKKLVRRGVPIAYRSIVWTRISLSSQYRKSFPDKYYSSLAEKESLISKRVLEEIEKDLERTFPQHENFTNNGAGEESLRRVLRAFAIHKPEIGYCQSLNFVAAFMLLLMDEEETFWLLATCTDTILPPDYYTPSMVGANVDHLVLCELIKTQLPNVHRYLEENSIDFPLISLQWLMCLFVNTFRPEVTLRVWDMLFNEGTKVLFRIAIALLKMHERELLAVKDTGDLHILLNSIGRRVVDPDVIIACAYKSYLCPKPKPKPTWGGKRHNITTGLGIAHKGIMDCSSSGQSSPIPPLLEDLTIGVPVERDRSYSLSPVISRGYASVADASVEQERYGAPSAGFLSSMFRRHLSSKSSLDMHKNFSRDRIESLRSQFRPAVLETYLAASVAREEWLRSQESEAAEVD